MNKLSIVILTFFMLFCWSCENNKVAQLEKENAKLKKENAELKAKIEKFEIRTKLEARKRQYQCTIMDMKTIGGVIEDYISDTYEAPQVNSFQDLKQKLEPLYIKKLPLKDCWGNNYFYQHDTGKNKEEYFIGSAGSDGKFEGFNQKGTYTESDGKDIIFSNGTFVFAIHR